MSRHIKSCSILDKKVDDKIREGDFCRYGSPPSWKKKDLLVSVLD